MQYSLEGRAKGGMRGGADPRKSSIRLMVFKHSSRPITGAGRGRNRLGSTPHTGRISAAPTERSRHCPECKQMLLISCFTFFLIRDERYLKLGLIVHKPSTGLLQPFHHGSRFASARITSTPIQPGACFSCGQFVAVILASDSGFASPQGSQDPVSVPVRDPFSGCRGRNGQPSSLQLRSGQSSTHLARSLY